MKATEVTHSDASMACAALRERPRPLLISARPAMARGTSRVDKRQTAQAGVSGRGPGITEIPRSRAHGNETWETPPPIRWRYPPAQKQSAPAWSGEEPGRTGQWPIPPEAIEC